MKENYETFCTRLRTILSPEDLLDVDLAYVLSKHAHRHQCRKETDPATGRPLRYFEHPRRVALILIDEVRCTDATLIICALLHDGIEDTRVINYAKVKHIFGRDIATIVRLLTKDESNKATYVERLMTSADWRALIVKACDRLDNLRSLASAGPEFQRKQAKETKEKYFALLDVLVRLTPKEYAKGARFLRREIRKKVREIERGLSA